MSRVISGIPRVLRSRVGNVNTTTLLVTGEDDLRTPISEAEQFYQALKIRGIDTLLLRIPGAAHSLDVRPSQLIARTQYILAWFGKYGGAAQEGSDPSTSPR